MDALKAEARKIEEEMEEFSSRTAKEVASLVTSISNIEDESEKMKKRAKCINSEVETLIHEKEAIKASLAENDEKLKELLAKKNEMDEMVDIEMKKFKDRETEVREILSRLSVSDPPWPSSTSADGEMIEFLNQSISEREEDLLCPVCLEVAQTPIFTCPDSHIICSACVPKLKAQECPQCRVALPNPLKRHRFAEKTAADLEKLVQKMAKLTGMDPDVEPQNIGEKHADDPKGACSLAPEEGQKRKTKGKWQRGVPVDASSVGIGFQTIFTEDDARKLNWKCGSTSEISKVLFVGNLPEQASEEQIAQAFERYGRGYYTDSRGYYTGRARVTKVEINRDPEKLYRDNNTVCPNFCFVEFDTKFAVNRVLDHWSGSELYVAKAKPCVCQSRKDCYYARGR